VKEVIGRPIAFASTGEKLADFEQFHPDRMAGRILGMGDVLSLIEQAEQAFEKDQAEKAAEKLLEGEFTLDDFLEQMQALKKMGPLGNVLGMLPGVPKEMKNAQIGDDALKPIEAIIRSMTPLERRKPEIINGSRRTRIANGSGTSVAEVNRLIKQFQEMQKMMKRMGAMAPRPGKKGKGKSGKGGRSSGPPRGMPPGFGGGLPGFPGMPGMPGQGGFPGLPGAGGFPPAN
jgi:signal recognition particle subunit SRP54